MEGEGQRGEAGERRGSTGYFWNLQNVCLTCTREWPRNVFDPERSKVTTPTAKRKMECGFLPLGRERSLFSFHILNAPDTLDRKRKEYYCPNVRPLYFSAFSFCEFSWSLVLTKAHSVLSSVYEWVRFSRSVHAWYIEVTENMRKYAVGEIFGFFFFSFRLFSYSRRHYYTPLGMIGSGVLSK